MRTNTNLEKEFDLAPMNLESEETAIELSEPITLDHYQELDKINEALPVVHGLDSSDQELDELAEYAITAHKDLMDLAMNVEQRFAGEISGAAANFLGQAITARTNKIKKKLDMIALQIKKQVADSKTKTGDDTPPVDGQSKVLDRNDLLALLQEKTK